MSTGACLQVFVRQDVRRTGAWAGVFFLAVSLLGTLSATKQSTASFGGELFQWITTTILVTASLLLIYRALTGSRIAAYNNGLAVRSLLRTRWYLWSQVSDFGTVNAVVNANPWSRRCVLTFYHQQKRVLVTSFTAPLGLLKVWFPLPVCSCYAA
jgi:hypothetical protein